MKDIENSLGYMKALDATPSPTPFATCTDYVSRCTRDRCTPRWAKLICICLHPIHPPKASRVAPALHGGVFVHITEPSCTPLFFYLIQLHVGCNHVTDILHVNGS